MDQNTYMIRFDYDHYCQGYEDATETVLVRASSYEDACLKIKAKTHTYKNARNFRNLTIE